MNCKTVNHKPYKVCSKCDNKLPISLFRKCGQSTMGQRFRGECKKCSIKYDKIWNKNRYAHKDKRRAMSKLHEAVKSKKIIKENCLVCSNSNYIDAHHPDYNKPLEVIWLCKSCHQKVHCGTLVIKEI